MSITNQSTQTINDTSTNDTIEIDIITQVASSHYVNPEKVRYKVIGVEMKGMESSMKLVALGATQRRG